MDLFYEVSVPILSIVPEIAFWRVHIKKLASSTFLHKFFDRDQKAKLSRLKRDKREKASNQSDFLSEPLKNFVFDELAYDGDVFSAFDTWAPLMSS